MRVKFYKDAKGEWRWRLVAKNGEPVAVSSEGYKNEADCRAMFWRIILNAPSVYELH